MKTMNRLKLIIVGTTSAAMLLLASISIADTKDEEINYLLREVDKSDCTGKRIRIAGQ